MPHRYTHHRARKANGTNGWRMERRSSNAGRASHRSRKLAVISRSLILCSSRASEEGSSPEERYADFCWDAEREREREGPGRTPEKAPDPSAAASLAAPPQCHPGKVRKNVRRTFSIKVRPLLP